MNLRSQLDYSSARYPGSIHSSRAPGNAIDWMYKVRGIKYSFAVHLRDTGTVSLNAFRYVDQLPTHSIPVRIFAPTAVDPAGRRGDLKIGRVSGKLHQQQTRLNRVKALDVDKMKRTCSEDPDGKNSRISFSLLHISHFVVRYIAGLTLLSLIHLSFAHERKRRPLSK